MSSQRIRTPGNLPETRIYCEAWAIDLTIPPCRNQVISGRDAAHARRVARALGWTRTDGRDFCPDHSDVVVEERD